MKLVYLTLLTGLFMLTTPLYANENSINATMVENPSTDITQTISPKEDALISKKLHQLIKNHQSIASLPITFTVKNGIVHYQGNVDSDDQASLLISAAESIKPVSDIDTSNLKVNENQALFDDLIITAKIKGLFVREKLLGEKDIASLNTLVESQNGIVYLTGNTDNQQQINNAIELIKKSIPGVDTVNYKMKKTSPISG